MSEEVFEIVNDKDEVIGQAPRSQVHANRWLHRAVHIFVFNAKGELFLQKRSMKKDCSPGRWDSSASGHVDAGETYDECSIRELKEELGLTPGHPPEKLCKVSASPQTGYEFFWLYLVRSDGPFHLHPEEIDDGEWFTCEEINDWMENRPKELASSFCIAWKKFREMESKEIS